MCFGVFFAEALIADTHDGDAARAGSGASAVIADVPDAGSPSVPNGQPSEPTLPGHQWHLCHCVHTHTLLAPGDLDIEATVLAAANDPPTGISLAPTAGAVEPQLRPPIA